MPRPIFFLALGLGGFFAVAALVLFCRTLWLVRRGVEAEGRVLRYEVRETLEYAGGVRFSGSYPVIAFEDAAGRSPVRCDDRHDRAVSTRRSADHGRSGTISIPRC